MEEQLDIFGDDNGQKGSSGINPEGSEEHDVLEQYADCNFDAQEVSWTVRDVFSSTGHISKSLAGYEVRQPQVDLALAIEVGIQDGENVVAEGPTGTGKSLAYLVPVIKAVLEASGSDARVVVGTANIALQEQLVNKDLPFLQRILKPEFKFSLVKGLGNYYCHRAAERLKVEIGQGVLPQGKNPNEYPIEKFYSVFPKEIVKICEWANRSETGDKSELPFEPRAENWSQVSSTADQCLGAGCKLVEKCFAKRARKALQDTHVLVVNYHMLFSAIVVRGLTGKNIILPPFKFLVCDEAHRVPDIARRFFGWDISQVAINRLLVQCRKRLREAERTGGFTGDQSKQYSKLSDNASSALESTWSSIGEFYGKAKGALRVKVPNVVQGYNLGNICKEIAEAMNVVSKIIRGEGKVEAQKISVRFGTIGDGLLEITDIKDDNGVYFVEKFGKSGQLRLCKRLKNVSDIIWQDMISRTYSTIATSATMAIEGNCQYVKDEMGMKESTDIVVDSPFNYKNQALMILSEWAPDPSQSQSYPEKVARIVKFIIDSAKGRTLGLFTSYRVLRIVAQFLRDENIKYPLFVQGDAPRIQLVDKFKMDESSVLLGTDSFWTGIDVPGPSLSCLVMDKIPFPSPGDPVLDALQEAAGGFRASFFKISVPRAVLQFRQGAGRLIRSRADRGVFVVLDNRLITKGYGHMFYNSLPPMRRGKGIKNGEIADWLNNNKEAL